MADLFKYRIYCQDEAAFKEVWKESDDPAPSTCPDNTVHTIDGSKTHIVEQALSRPLTDSEGKAVVSEGGPRDYDNKLVVVEYPASLNRKTFFTGAGDNVTPTPPSSGRGEGDPIRCVWNGSESFPDTKTATWHFVDCVEVHDGELSWKPVDNFSGADRFTFQALIPATVPSSTPGTGNINVVPLGGGLEIYTPAPLGNGSHTVNLTNFSASNKACPVPGEVGQAYWKFNESGVISFLDGTENPNSRVYNLYNFPLVANIVKNVGLGNPMGVFAIEAYRVETIHQTWACQMTIVKETAGAGEANGWLLTYRISQM